VLNIYIYIYIYIVCPDCSGSGSSLLIFTGVHWAHSPWLNNTLMVSVTEISLPVISVSLLIKGPLLWSSGQSFWLQIQRSLVRFPALPDFLSSGSGMGSTQPREYN
jgi:hypothetical protein